MFTIVCYGDSNTWGCDAESGSRHPIGIRWPGVLRAQFGGDAHIIEEGLNGRTTVFEEPFRSGRNGSIALQMILESHDPIDLIIVALGANDMKPIYNASGYDSALGLRRLLQIIKSSAAGPKNTAPTSLVVAPVKFGNFSDATKDRFAGGHGKFPQLLEEYKKAADDQNAYFLNPNDEVVTSDADGVHLDGANHHKLGVAVSTLAKEILEGSKHNKSVGFAQLNLRKTP